MLTGPTSTTNADVQAEEELYHSLGNSMYAAEALRPHRSKNHGSSSSSGGRSLLPRRWATLVPGFLKLELVRQTNDEANSTAAAATANQQSSRKSSSSTSSGESLLKGTFWENAPTSMPLHVNSLITAQVTCSPRY